MKRMIWCGIAFMAFAGICLGQTVTAPQAATSVVECPARLGEPGAGLLSGVPMEEGGNVPVPTQAFLNTIPQGWSYQRTQTYSGYAYEIVNNGIVDNNFVCYYGIKLQTGPAYFVAIKKPIPATKSCKVVSGNKFQCQLKPLKIQ
jgi:hypothetical protein